MKIFLNTCDIDGNRLDKSFYPIEMTINDGQPRETDLIIIHKSGKKIPVSIRVSTIKDNSQNIIGAIELLQTSVPKLLMNFESKSLKKWRLLII